MPLWLLLASTSALAQGVKEERGTYRLTCFGREAGEESFTLSEFDNGSVVLASKVSFEVEIQGEKRGYVLDTSLVMSRAFAPVRYASYHKTGRQEKIVKLEWERGRVLADRARPQPTKATHVLDANTVAQILPLLRTPGAPKKIKAFRPAALQDQDVLLEDRGELLLAGPDASVKVREWRVSSGYLDVVVHVDERLRILRAWQVQTEVLAELTGFAGWKPVPPPPPGAAEEDVVVRHGQLALAGSLMRPKAAGPKAPAALILGAAGPQDRHGNVVRGKDGLERFAWEGPDASLYREIAAALVSAGLVVLRLDDRGCGKSGGDFATARLADLEADAEAAARWLKAREDVDRLLLLGHDEGGLIAQRIAPRVGAAGVVLLAAPATTLDVLLLESAERLLREQGTAEDLILRILEKERATYARIRDGQDDWMEIDERRTFVGWMRDRFRLDPLKAGTAPPWAVFHGERDEVVPAAHAARWGASTTVRLQGLDHVFRRTGGPVEPVFLRQLAEEVAARLRAGR